MNQHRKILIVEDEVGARESYKMILKDQCDLEFAQTADEGLAKFEKGLFDLLIFDIQLPDRSGISLLNDIRALDGIIPVIMVTATKEVETAVEAMKLGALDYLTKPFNTEELQVVVQKGLQTKLLQEEVHQLRGEVKRAYGFENIIGKGPKMQALYTQISRVLDTASTVLITGESGTGKELVARAIHYNGVRKEAPFVALHTAAISEKLLESELFGHEKGAFTDAIKTKRGMFEMANKGTLFLDEIGEMESGTQVKLLRVLQEREFRRVGGTENIKVDTRVIAATNKDLWGEVQAGRFREDLYYRLSVIPIELPPLRERKEDIPVLVHHLVQKLKKDIPASVERFSDETLSVLEGWQWSGNVRELQNIVERLLVTCDAKEVLPQHLPPQLQSSPKSNGSLAPVAAANGISLKDNELSLDDLISEYEKNLIEEALKESNHVQTNAAKLLKTTRRIIKYKMDQLGIQSKD